MKKILGLLILIAIGFVSKAQNYSDSTVTLTLTQRSAVYIAFYIKQNTTAVWQNRLAPGSLKAYVGSGANLDSMFTVTLKADYIIGLIDVLLTSQNEIVQADRLSIINGSPAISGYTSLATQIVNKSNGSSAEKNTATFILNYYNARVAQLAATRAAIIAQVVQWTQL